MVPRASSTRPAVGCSGRVLVVDDDDIFREVIGETLSMEGFEVLQAAGAREALSIFADSGDGADLDVVLLDLMLGEESGLDVLDRLRSATAAGERVPIVLVTGHRELHVRAEGLARGADDFLHKPVDSTELVCRLQTFTALRRAQRSLRERADQLAHLHQLRGELARHLVHDLKNPLTSVLANLAWVAHADLDDPELRPDVEGALEDAEQAARRLLGLVSGLVHIEQAETGRLHARRDRQSILPLVGGLVRQFRRDAEQRRVQLGMVVDPALEASVDADLLTRALENLVTNALRFAQGGRIEVGAELREEQLVLAVCNTGASLAARDAEGLFDRFGAARSGPAGHLHLGVGLHVCRLVVEAHHGTIQVVDDPRWATRIEIRLPIEEPRRQGTSAPHP